MKQKPKELKVDYSKPVEPIIIGDNVIVGYKNVEVKPKELEWQREFLVSGSENGCGDLSIMISTVSKLLTQQRTELLEEFRKGTYIISYFEDRLEEARKEERTELLEEILKILGSTQKQAYLADGTIDGITALHQVAEDVTNLLNKKDEVSTL